MALVDNRKFKNLDRVYLDLSKIYSEGVATNIVNDINKNGIMKYIYHHIKLSNIEYLENFIKSIENVKEYIQIVKDKMLHIIMCSIFSSETFKIAMQLYDKHGCPSKMDMNQAIAICIKRHAFVFPENQKLCSDFLDVFSLENLITDIHDIQILFVQDDVNLVKKFLKRKQETFQQVFIYASECSALKTVSKIMSYYKEPEVFLAKLSLPSILKYKLNLKDTEIRDAIFVEANNFSRWEFIPFIFDNFKIDEELWLTFKINIYRGYVTLPYLKTLLYHMKLHDIPIEKLKLQQASKLMASKEILNELREHGFDKFETFEEFDFKNDEVKYSASAMFEFFRRNKLEFIFNVLYANYAHVNVKLAEELIYIDTLLENNILGWDDKILAQYSLYEKFLDNIFTQLKVFDQILLDYNAFNLIKEDLDNTVALRCINKMIIDIKKITNKKITAIYATLILELNDIYMDYLNIFRKDFAIAPENFDCRDTLEGQFCFIYQYSYIRGDKHDNGELLRLAKYYKSVGRIDVYHLILKSIDCLCHHKDVKDLLIENNLL
jgi:hypothetical protein